MLSQSLAAFQNILCNNVGNQGSDVKLQIRRHVRPVMSGTIRFSV